MLASPTGGTETTASTSLNTTFVMAKTPMKRLRMLFIAIEAIYVMLNLKNKKVPMSALTTRLTEDDLSRMQVASASEAVEKAQEAGFIKVENGPGGSSLVSFAADDVRLYWTLDPVLCNPNLCLFIRSRSCSTLSQWRMHCVRVRMSR